MDRVDRDQVVVLPNVTWEQYVALADARQSSQPRMAYLDGVLEIMTTGRPHEGTKTLLARLLEAYAEETAIRFDGFGNATARKKSKQAGLEPDECYFVSREEREDSFPDLAIEVVYYSGRIDKLEIYRRLGVKEVWRWKDDEIAIHRLVRPRSGEPAYRKEATSRLLPGVDLDELARIVRGASDQTATVRAYRRALQKRLSR
jgi:Uma2 family endonuclease